MPTREQVTQGGRLTGRWAEVGRQARRQGGRSANLWGGRGRGVVVAPSLGIVIIVFLSSLHKTPTKQVSALIFFHHLAAGFYFRFLERQERKALVRSIQTDRQTDIHSLDCVASIFQHIHILHLF